MEKHSKLVSSPVKEVTKNVKGSLEEGEIPKEEFKDTLGIPPGKLEVGARDIN